MPLFLTLFLSTAAATPPPPPPDAGVSKSDVAAETKVWHDRRVSRLRAEDGWLSLVGLSWLKPGDNKVGSAKDADVHLPPSAPRVVGTLNLDAHGVVTLKPGPTVVLLKNDLPFDGGPLKSDDNNQDPDVVRLGTVRMLLLKRGTRWAIRVKDSEAPTRVAFTDIPAFAPSAEMRITARFVPAVPARKISVPNILGEVESMTFPGSLYFKLKGKEYRLDPVIEEGEDQLFIIFADATNHTETYPSGRFLSAPMPKNGEVVLDFNRAYNPPCAFTAFATCPLPPAQNKLDVRIEAGEKRYGNAHPH